MHSESYKLLSTSYITGPGCEALNKTKLRTIADCLDYNATTFPNKDAFVFSNTDGSRIAVSWKQLYEQSKSAARGFIKLGVKRHEFVGVNIRSCPEWLFVTFGIILAGARSVNIAFTYTDGSDVVAMMEKAGTCSTMVLDAGIDENDWKIFRKLIDDHSVDGTVRSTRMPYLRHLVLLNYPTEVSDVKTFTDILTVDDSSIDLPNLGAGDIACLLQTSGSTGLPKLIAHTHASLLMYGRQLSFREIDAIQDHTNLTLYNDRPFSWIGGWPITIESGQTRVTRSGFDETPEDIVAFICGTIKKENCNILAALPPMIHTFVQRKAEAEDIWPIDVIATGGQPVTKDLASAAKLLCKTFVCLYGSSESPGCSIHVVADPENVEEFSCGHVLDGVEVKIVDKNEEVVPVGENGEIYIRSPAMFKCYWNDAEKTKSSLSADGWYKTDDIGHLSKTGMLYVEGRKSHMIISGGMNVSPAILETAIKTCPDVKAVVIVPISDPVLYQVICACLILEPGSNATEESLKIYCESLHNDKPGLFTVLPKYYLLMKEFPETHTGKTARNELASVAETLLNKSDMS